MEAERLQRASSPALDEILGQQFNVLDRGFIRVVDYMGNDSSIVQAARVSYGKGTKTISDDEGLIRYLMRHDHTSPFEMCDIKLHVKVPMDAWRQWIRHRTASVNEISSRYSEVKDERQQTLPDAWRLQSKDNKQGSKGYLEQSLGENLTINELELQQHAQQVYQERIDLGVAKEQARKDLPLSTYTEAYWEIDLKNLIHFLTLRMESHAQLEIRSYASLIGEEIVSRWVPLTWQAFKDYRLNAIKLSAQEIEIISKLIDPNRVSEEYLNSLAQQQGLTTKVERAEFIKKVRRITGE
ncbi:FAD-dependent thymidylate synthase [Candidatus Woesearchaeota archaeon]|nr:FAD-dependent thymidylate synthase [Candidatus Woesearchaeota archaeon]